MAVEAHHLLLHPGGGGQKLAAWEGGGALCSDVAAPAGRHGGCYYGTAADVASAVLLGRQQSRHHQLLPPPPAQGYLQLQHQQQPSPCVVGPLAAAPAVTGPTMVTTVGQYGAQLSASESGVTFGGGVQDAAVMPSRKRIRRAAADEQPQQQVLGLGGVAAHLQQQQLLDVDRIVLQHTSKMWAELAEHRRRHARQVAAAAEAAAARRLRAKDEEIARVARHNWALEERVRALVVEAQVWRDLAMSNEAAANALRVDLQQALDAQARRGVVLGATAEAADDAASCCCGENDVGAGGEEEEEVGTAAATTSGNRRRCAVCCAGAAEVLLLPCRHLCACAPCADAARACPACGCAKNGSVCVNFS